MGRWEWSGRRGVHRPGQVGQWGWRSQAATLQAHPSLERRPLPRWQRWLPTLPAVHTNSCRATPTG